MRSIWKPGLFFVFCLLIALLVNMPATQLVGRIKLPDTIGLNGLDGTLFSGRVSQLTIDKFPIQNLSYRADSFCLLTLSICYQFDNPDGLFHLRIRPLTETVEISDLAIDYPLQQLTPFMQQLLVKPSGKVELKLDSAQAVKGQLTGLSGVAIWRNAGVSGESVNLGDYEFLVSGSGDLYTVSLKDIQAPLQVVGKVDLKTNGTYQVNIDIKARSGLDPKIQNVLEFVALKKGINQYVIQNTGKLPAQFQAYLAGNI